MSNFLQTLWSNQRGQDIAEYAVILAFILVLVVGSIGRQQRQQRILFRGEFSSLV